MRPDIRLVSYYSLFVINKKHPSFLHHVLLPVNYTQVPQL